MKNIKKMKDLYKSDVIKKRNKKFKKFMDDYRKETVNDGPLWFCCLTSLSCCVYPLLGLGYNVCSNN